jgi:hypothetical protein
MFFCSALFAFLHSLVSLLVFLVLFLLEPECLAPFLPVRFVSFQLCGERPFLCLRSVSSSSLPGLLTLECLGHLPHCLRVAFASVCEAVVVPVMLP